MKICVLSGRYPVTNDFLSAENHRIYCDYHGYTYIYGNWPTPAKNPYLIKVYFLQHYLELFDYIFWIDYDAFFLDITKPLTDFIPEGDNIISICSSPANKVIKTVFTGCAFMVSSARGKEFVDKILTTDMEIVKQWWKPEFGLFCNGEQDIMVYLFLADTEFKNKFNLFDHNAFNSRFKDLEEGVNVFILHLTGPRRQKKRLIKKHKLY